MISLEIFSECWPCVWKARKMLSKEMGEKTLSEFKDRKIVFALTWLLFNKQKELQKEHNENPDKHFQPERSKREDSINRDAVL